MVFFNLILIKKGIHPILKRTIASPITNYILVKELSQCIFNDVVHSRVITHTIYFDIGSTPLNNTKRIK